MLSLISQKDAENSATIALFNMRDSTAMKTIGVLTTLFLPGTFVATLFSTTMFNWNVPGNGSGGSSTTADSPAVSVSPYIWVYWAISIPLTSVVMLLWLFWSRREHRKTQMKLVIRRQHDDDNNSNNSNNKYKFEDPEKGVEQQQQQQHQYKMKFSWISEKQ